MVLQQNERRIRNPNPAKHQKQLLQPPHLLRVKIADGKLSEAIDSVSRKRKLQHHHLEDSQFDTNMGEMIDNPLDDIANDTHSVPRLIKSSVATSPTYPEKSQDRYSLPSTRPAQHRTY